MDRTFQRVSRHRISHRPGRVRRLLAALGSVALGVAATLVATAVIAQFRPVSARADEITASQNLLRDGWDQNEPGLSPAVVHGGTFGQLFSTPVNGQVYAQPLIAGSTVIVTTETDSVYGLNAVTGAVIWSDNLGPALPASAQGCDNITPNIGITGTPVYDPSTGTVYLVAVVNDGPNIGEPHVYMYALSAQTGAVQWKAPIQGAPVNAPGQTFDSLTERQRAGLLEMNGSIYAAFGSYCDLSPYIGWVAGVNTATKAVTLWTDEAGLTDTQGGIWEGGGGLMSDGPGRIFVTTGNGVSPAPGPGSTPPPELGDAVARLNVTTDGTLSSADFFSPANAPVLDANDTDFGSGGPVGLPFGTGTYPDLLVQVGKDGRVFLLNRDSLGGREQGANGSDDYVSESGPFQGQWGHPAAFGDTTTVTTSTSSDFVYYVGTQDDLRFLKFGVNSSGTPVLTDVANSTATFGYTSGSPVVTSNGTDTSSAVVWEIYAANSSGANGTLEAFDAVPGAGCTAAASCTMSPIWSAPIGTASEFDIPATDGGRVYVGTRDGRVLGFGSPDAAPLTASAVNFGQVTVGGAPVTRNVTVTAASAVTVSAITPSSTTATDPFKAGTPTLGGNPVTPPVSLTAGQALTVPVTFTPTGPGGVTGALGFATGSPNFPTVNVGLTGAGTKAGFYAGPAAVSFGSVPDRTSMPVNVTITNGGTTAETVTGTTPPLAPFTVTGLPAAGAVLNPGASLTVIATYKPTGTTADSGSFTIDGSTGNVTVSLSGTGLAAVSQFTPVPAAVTFGSVPLGQQATQTIDITNTGNQPATVAKAIPPGVPFGAPQPVSAGLPVNPGYDLELPVTFSPTSVGGVARTYQLTWTDAGGTHTVSVPVSGTGVAPASGIAVPPPGGGWTLNGSARMLGSSVELTQAVPSQAGSAVYSVPEPSGGLTAKFTAAIGGGTGADGMTFSLLDASKASRTSLGGGGGGLGFAALPGVAVALDTYHDSGYPSGNFVGIATGASGRLLKYVATATNIPALRSGTHTIGVTVSGQQVTVTVDGKTVLNPTLPAGSVPASVLPAFTAGTGSLTDDHTVTTATITASGSPLPRPGGGWSYNGSAALSGSDSVLTPAVGHLAGSVVYPVPVQTSGLAVQFDAQLSGGTGADGLTFALLNPAVSRATSLGGPGGELGFGGLTGVAVTLDTWKDPTYPNANFVGLSTAASGGVLEFQATAVTLPPLRTGTQTVSVGVVSSGGTDVLTVRLDGLQILQFAEPSLTATSLLAFTGGTGGATDVHIVRDVAISAG